MLYRGKRVRERGRLPKGKFPKKGGRRLVSGLLALVLCLTLVPVIYADTVVTVTSWYAAGAFEENTLYWVDNNNEDGVRPGANTYQPSLWFRIDNGEWIELKGGEESTLSGVGLSAMPRMTVADNGNNTYTVSVPAGVSNVDQALIIFAAKNPKRSKPQHPMATAGRPQQNPV